MSDAPSLVFSPGEPALNAFYKYANDPIFRAFMMSLEARGMQLLMLSAQAKDEVMYRAQGRASELMDVSTAFQEFLLSLGKPIPESAAGATTMEGFQ